MQRVKILDAETRHAKHPTVFKIPSLEAIDSISAGIRVKLIFYVEPTSLNRPKQEEMWVQVRTVNRKKGLFKGAVSNTPHELQGFLHKGSPVVFSTKNIISIYEAL